MNERERLDARLKDGLHTLGLALPAGATDVLLDYVALLVRWNGAYNLTAIRDPDEMVTRHLLDSLVVLPYIRGKTLADLGTGPGLPGIPLAVAAPQRAVTLVDSNGKKVRFLREAVRVLKLANVHVIEARVADVDGQFDCITARAFSSLANMLVWGGKLLAPDGEWLALKGRRPNEELQDVPTNFVVKRIMPLSVPKLDAERHLIVIKRKDRETAT